MDGTDEVFTTNIWDTETPQSFYSDFCLHLGIK